MDSSNNSYNINDNNNNGYNTNDNGYSMNNNSNYNINNILFERDILVNSCHTKIKTLEEENRNLRIQHSNLASTQQNDENEIMKYKQIYGIKLNEMDQLRRDYQRMDKLYSDKIQLLEKERNQVLGNTESLKKDIQAQKDQLNENQLEISKLKELLKKANKRKDDRIEVEKAQRLNIQNQCNQLQTQYNQLQEEMVFLKSSVEHLQSQSKNDKTDLKYYEQTNVEYINQIIALTEKNEKSEKEKQELTTQYSELYKKYSKLKSTNGEDDYIYEEEENKEKEENLNYNNSNINSNSNSEDNSIDNNNRYIDNCNNSNSNSNNNTHLYNFRVDNSNNNSIGMVKSEKSTPNKRKITTTTTTTSSEPLVEKEIVKNKRKKEDQDLVVCKQSISIYCPITLSVIVEPYISLVCNHVFSKSAILSLLSNSNSIRCPVSGCDKTIHRALLEYSEDFNEKIKQELAKKEKEDSLTVSCEDIIALDDD